MKRCFLCDLTGIRTVANSAEPLVVNGKEYAVCQDCHKLHFMALDRGLRTMFERLAPEKLRGIKARADVPPRQDRMGLLDRVWRGLTVVPGE